MIYTLGHRPSYIKALRSAAAINKPLKKVGRSEGYPGGYAFKTVNDAERRIAEKYVEKDYAVFVLLADWDKDTVPSEEGWWHALVNSAPIVLLD